MLAILGSGVQARSHLRAFSHVRALRDVRVWSPSEAHRARVRRRDASRDRGADLPPSQSAQEAVDGADLVVLATAAREPVLQSDWIADGAHIAAVGACRPDQRKMDTALVARARVFVDSQNGALAEAGDRAADSRRGDSTRRTSRASSASWRRAPSPGGRRPARSRSSSRWEWRSKMSRPRTSPIERATERGLGRGIPW